MNPKHDKRFPGESPEYRQARNKLLEAELALRQQVEDVAAMRRHLPLGGRIEKDYLFQELDESGAAGEVSLSSLFAPGKDSLILYNFMYGPDWAKPCPMCTALVDGFEGNSQYVRQRANIAVVAKAGIEKLSAWGKERGWKRVRLLSSHDSSFNADYNAQFPSNYGDQHPVMHVFVRRDGKIYHQWSSEVLFTQSETDPRHVDMIWPLWNLFDLIPEGRGSDWYPSFQK